MCTASNGFLLLLLCITPATSFKIISTANGQSYEGESVNQTSNFSESLETILSAISEEEEDEESIGVDQEEGTCQVFIKAFSLRTTIWNVDLEGAKVQDLHEFVNSRLKRKLGVDPPESMSSANQRVAIGHRESRNPPGGPTFSDEHDALLTDLGLECLATIQIIPRAYGGLAHATVSRPEELDWVVMLKVHKNGGRYTCTGNLFSSANKILTAGHCVSPGDKVTRIDIHPAHGPTRTASAFYIHPGYYPDERYSRNGVDMAMIEYTGTNIYQSFGRGMGSHSYLTGDSSRYTSSGASINLAGYGTTQRRADGSGTLHQGQFTAGNGCTPRRYGACASSGPRKLASCGGDSGGPWFVNTRTSDGIMRYIVGIHIGGANCQDSDGNESPDIASAESDFMLLSETTDFWWGTRYRTQSGSRRWAL
jgi:hypothetical protein